MDVTESQLATALEEFWVRVRATSGAMGTSRAQIADADETAKSLYATLSRMAALREPHPTDADLCARCGNQFKPGQVCDPCRQVGVGPWGDDVVEAHVCCEHVPDDQELSAMAEVIRQMGRVEIDPYAVVRALYPLNGHELHRVLRWFLARYPGVTDPVPF